MPAFGSVRREGLPLVFREPLKPWIAIRNWCESNSFVQGTHGFGFVSPSEIGATQRVEVVTFFVLRQFEALLAHFTANSKAFLANLLYGSTMSETTSLISSGSVDAPTILAAK